MSDSYNTPSITRRSHSFSLYLWPRAVRARRSFLGLGLSFTTYCTSSRQERRNCLSRSLLEMQCNQQLQKIYVLTTDHSMNMCSTARIFPYMSVCVHPTQFYLSVHMSPCQQQQESLVKSLSKPAVQPTHRNSPSNQIHYTCSRVTWVHASNKQQEISCEKLV